MNRLIDEKELSGLLGVARSTLGYLRREKGLPHVQLAERVVRFDLDQVRAWLAERARGGRAA